MTPELKATWQKNFPLWPDVLVQKFADQIEIESNFFDPQFGAAQKQFFSDAMLKLNRNYTLAMTGGEPTALNASLTLFNPTNPQYYARQDYSLGRIYLFSGFAPPNLVGNQNSEMRGFWSFGPYQKKATDFTFTGIWDNRLFGGFDLSINVEARATEPNYNVSFLSIMSYESATVTPIQNFILVTMNNAAKPYAQSDSIIALHENGVDMPGVNYEKLYEFNSYVKASQNYNAQIQGAAEVAKKTAEADILNYRSDLDSKLLAQKNQLQNLSLQLTAQTAGQADSAKRDVQQLSLQVASIKLQLLGMLK